MMIVGLIQSGVLRRHMPPLPLTLPRAVCKVDAETVIVPAALPIRADAGQERSAQRVCEQSRVARVDQYCALERGAAGERLALQVYFASSVRQAEDAVGDLRCRLGDAV